MFRVSQPGERVDICDVMFINRHNIDEANHLPTQLMHEGFHMVPHQRIWSGLPCMLPLAVCIEDGSDRSYLPPGYENHEWVGHCTSEMIQAAEGRVNASSCHTNLLQTAQQICHGEWVARLASANVCQPATWKLNDYGRSWATPTCRCRPNRVTSSTSTSRPTSPSWSPSTRSATRL